MLDRLAWIAEHHAVALAYPVSGTGWQLEWWDGPVFRVARLQGQGADGLTSAAREACGMVGVESVHIENPTGFDRRELLEVCRLDIGVAMTLHDYSFYCPRPHLIERPYRQHCAFSTDDDRCAACLQQDWPVATRDVPEYRRVSQQILSLCDLLIFPSENALNNVMARLGGPPHFARAHVIAPATARRFDEGRPSRRRRKPRFGVVGGSQEHKGAHLIQELARAILRRQPTGRITSFGGGDLEIAALLKRAPEVRNRGYYRAGDLPRLLQRHRISVAIMPSIWPETYGLVVDECISARVPVVAFNLGAVAERIAEIRAGTVVEITDGPEGLAEAATRLVWSDACNALPDGLPTVRDSAESHLELYR